MIARASASSFPSSFSRPSAPLFFVLQDFVTLELLAEYAIFIGNYDSSWIGETGPYSNQKIHEIIDT